MKQEDPAKTAEQSTLHVHNGTYTVAHPKQGHFTLKVYTVLKGDLIGKRIISLLVGPDNTSNYKGVAFWDDERKVANVWRRHRGPDSWMAIDSVNWQAKGWSSVEQKLAIWCDLAVRGDGTIDELVPGTAGELRKRQGFWASEGYTLLREGRCVICNRKLTDPESIRSGIGPTCAGRS